jgi:hypothetical protein
MDDGRDSFLSRHLKNWAVQQRPPAGARERLLETAASSSIPVDKTIFSTFWTLIRLKMPDHASNDRLLGPLTQSRLWSFHIALDLRQVT